MTNSQILRKIKFCEPFQIESRFVISLDLESRFRLLSGIDTLFLRFFGGDLDDIALSDDEKDQLHEILIFRYHLSIKKEELC